MSDIITNVRIIYADQWKLEEDGKWYIHIPFECDNDTDTIMEFVDTEEYIEEHKVDFDCLNNGYSGNNECVISADHKPTCDMQIEIKTIDEAGGRIMYDKNGNPEYIPEQSSFGGLFGALGGMMGGVSMPDLNNIVDAEGKVISSVDNKEEVEDNNSNE